MTQPNDDFENLLSGRLIDEANHAPRAPGKDAVTGALTRRSRRRRRVAAFSLFFVFFAVACVSLSVDPRGWQSSETLTAKQDGEYQEAQEALVVIEGDGSSLPMKGWKVPGEPLIEAPTDMPIQDYSPNPKADDSKAESPSPSRGPASNLGLGGSGGGGSGGGRGSARRWSGYAGLELDAADDGEAGIPYSNPIAEMLGGAEEIRDESAYEDRTVGRDASSDPTSDPVSGKKILTPEEQAERDRIRAQRQAALKEARAAARRIYGAGQGELWAQPRFGEQGAIVRRAVAFPLKHTDVKAHISGLLASTIVRQSYHNDFDEAIEAVYVFPLPEKAAINGFRVVVGERVIVGLIRKREEARQIYEAARAQGYTASLLEQERPNIFTQSVANIAPKTGVDIEITYFHRLARQGEHFEYVFPMVVGPRYTGNTPDADRITPPTLPAGMRNGHDIAVEVRIDAGMALNNLSVPTHEVTISERGMEQAIVTLAPNDAIPNRDFILRFSPFGRDVRTGLVAHTDKRSGYCSLTFTPPIHPAERDISPREITFLLDTSGSMGGVPIETSKHIMERVLDGLRPSDSFNIFFFAGGNGQLWDLPRVNTPENVAEAKGFLQRINAGGGTEMLAGLERLFASPREMNRLRMVVFMTDGYVGDEERILAAVKANNGSSRFFIYGIGSSVNRDLIDGIGRHGRGHASVVLPREDGSTDKAAQEFFDHIDAPVLTDISIDWGRLPVKEAYPSLVPDLFAGQPLELFARYEGGGSGNITIHGYKGGVAVSYTVWVDLPTAGPDNPSIAAMWAREKIADLTDRRLGTYDNDYHGLTEAITQTALDYSLVSENTSFVAVDSAQKVGDGAPPRVDVPVEQPQDVDRAGTGRD